MRRAVVTMGAVLRAVYKWPVTLLSYLVYALAWALAYLVAMIIRAAILGGRTGWREDDESY